MRIISRTRADLSFKEIFISIFKLFNFRRSVKDNNVHIFEKSFAGYIGVKNAVSFINCRSAMYFALKALGFKSGDEIILPSFNYHVNSSMVLLAGLKPIFVDVDFFTANIDLNKIESVITKKTKAIFLTHLNGNYLDINGIINIAEKYKLRIIEDCARACGLSIKNKKLGSYDIGVFSFGWGKSFFAYGGGMLVSNDEKLISKINKIKKDFFNISYFDLLINIIKGILLQFMHLPFFYRLFLFNFVIQYQVKKREKFNILKIKKFPYESIPKKFFTKYNNIQSEIGLIQLKKIDNTNMIRKRNTYLLNEGLKNIKQISIFKTKDNTAIHYPIWTDKRDELIAFLTKYKIDAKIESAEDCTLIPRNKKFVNGRFKISNKLHNKLLWLPNHPFIKTKEIEYIIDKVKEFFGLNTNNIRRCRK